MLQTINGIDLLIAIVSVFVGMYAGGKYVTSQQVPRIARQAYTRGWLMSQVDQAMPVPTTPEDVDAALTRVLDDEAIYDWARSGL